MSYNYNPSSQKAEEFINHEEILETLSYAEKNKNNVELIDQILAKARLRKGLSHREAAVLLDCEIPEKVEEIFELARQIKQDFYGNRIVMFAPLYLSNYCVNGCVYCPYHMKNNARIAIKNARLQREQLEQGLKADLSNLWQAYQNNLQMLKLERQNLVAAKENHEIAMERYMLGNLSGIEMREAQKSLLDAEERILSAEYDTKLCEISLLQISGKITKYLE